MPDWRTAARSFLDSRLQTESPLAASMTPEPATPDWRSSALGFLQQRESMAEIPAPAPSHEREVYLSSLAEAAGAKPDPVTGRYPSDYKTEAHPNIVAGGFHTKTRARVPNMPRADYQELLDVGWNPEAAAELAATPEPGRPTVPMVAQGVTTPGSARTYQPGEPVPAPPVTGPAAVWKPADAAMDALATRRPTAAPSPMPFNPPRFAGLDRLAPLPSHAPSPLEAGNIKLEDRPQVWVPKESGYGTVRSMTIGEDGRTVLIPTIIEGRVLSAQEAINHYKLTGEHLGKFATLEQGEAASQALHEDYASGKIRSGRQTAMGVELGAPMAPGLEEVLVAAEQSPMTLAAKRVPGVGPLELPAIRPPKRVEAPKDEQGPMGLADFIGGLTQKTPGERIAVPFEHPEMALPETSLSKEGVSKLPFIGSLPAIADAYNLIRAARRVRDGNGTEADQGVLDDYVAKEAEAKRRGTTILYDIANVASQIPAFGVEFMATRGAFTAVKKLVTEAVAKRLVTSGAKAVAELAAERLATKAAGYTAGALAQTAAMPWRIAAEAGRRQAPTADEAGGGAEALRDWNDDFVPALAKAIPDQFVEIFSERTGGLIEGVGGKLAKLPVANRVAALKEAVLSRWLQMHPEKGVREFFDQVRTKSGWNGVLGEMFEERVGEAMRAAQPYLREPGQPQPAMLRMVTGDPTAETAPGENPRAQAAREFGRQLVVEAAAFAVPGAVRGLSELATRERPASPESTIPTLSTHRAPPNPPIPPVAPPPPPTPAAVPPPVAATPVPPAAEPPTAEEKAAAKAEMKRRMQEAGLLPADVAQETPHAVQEPGAAPLPAQPAPEDRGGVGQEVRPAGEAAGPRQAEGAAKEVAGAPFQVGQRVVTADGKRKGTVTSIKPMRDDLGAFNVDVNLDDGARLGLYVNPAISRSEKIRPLSGEAAEKEAEPHVYFRSGVSSAPADIDGFVQAGVPVGVTANKMTATVAKKVQDYLAKGGKVFIDSGAFGNDDIDFGKVLDTYADVVENAKGNRGNIWVVAPDKVGDADETFKLQAYHQLAILRLAYDKGVNVILPIQKGATIEDQLWKIVDHLPVRAGADQQQLIVGIPSNKARFTPEEIAEGLRNFKAQHITEPGEGAAKAKVPAWWMFKRFHLLGMGENNRDFQATVDAIRSVVPDAMVTADSNRMSAIVGQGRALEKGEPEARVDSVKAEAADVAAAGEATPEDYDALRKYFYAADAQDEAKAILDEELEKKIEEAGYPPALIDAVLHDAIAKRLAPKAPTQKVRTQGIATHEEKAETKKAEAKKSVKKGEFTPPAFSGILSSYAKENAQVIADNWQAVADYLRSLGYDLSKRTGGFISLKLDGQSYGLAVDMSGHIVPSRWNGAKAKGRGVTKIKNEFGDIENVLAFFKPSVIEESAKRINEGHADQKRWSDKTLREVRAHSAKQQAEAGTFLEKLRIQASLEVYDLASRLRGSAAEDVAAPAEVAEAEKPTEPSDAPPVTKDGLLAWNGAWYVGPRGWMRRTSQGNYELKFETKPASNVLDGLKKSGWKWSPPNKVWYHKPGPGIEDTGYNVTGVPRPGKAEAAPTPREPNPHEWKPSGRVAVKGPSVKGADWNQIGRNAIGKTLYEDERGVRSYIENGVRIVEPVQLTPVRDESGRPRTAFSVDRTGDREREWSVVEEDLSKPAEAKTEAGGFKIGDRVSVDEGFGEIQRFDGDNSNVKIAIEPDKQLSHWIPVARVTHLEAEPEKAPAEKHVPAPASTRPNFEHFELTDEGLEDDIADLLSLVDEPLTKYQQEDLASLEAELAWREKTLVYNSATNDALHNLLTYIPSWDKDADPASRKGLELLEAQAQILVDIIGHENIKVYHAAVDVMTQDELSFASAVLEGHLGVEPESSTDLDRAITRLRRGALEAAGQTRIDFEKAVEPAEPAAFKPPTTRESELKAYGARLDAAAKPLKEAVAGFPAAAEAEAKAPTKYEATKAALDAEEDALWAKVRAKMNEAPTGIDPELAGIAVQLLGVYAKRGVNEFGEAVRLAVERVGRPLVEKMAIYLDAGWGLLHEDADEVSTHQVLTTLPAEPTVQEEGTDAADTESAGVRGRPAVRVGEPGEPAPGPRAESPEGVAGEQPGAAEAAPAAGGPAEGGTGGTRGGRRGPRRGSTASGRGSQPGTSGRADEPGDVDPADDVDDPNVVAAHARGERPKHFRITDAEELTTGASWIGKLENNMAALRLLKQLEAAKRPATADEQAILAKYIGWGHTNLAPIVASQDASDLAGKDPRLGKAREELERLLTPAELKDLGESAINAHYSFSDIPRALWGIAERLGFKGGRILEPAIGTGHFFGTMPNAIIEHPRTALFGVDKEPIAAAIAQQLYQGAIVQASPLEEARVPEDFFDIAISNVPFGKVEVFDPAFMSSSKALMTRSIHNYYFGKAIDAVRPGGLIIFVTSRYTMDSQNDSIRAYIADRAHFLGAFRMPSSAFKATAGTDVVTDVIVLQKKEPGATFTHGIAGWLKSEPRKDLGAEWNEEKGREELIHTNEYFVAHPEQVLGEEDRSGKMNRGPRGYNVVGELTAGDLARAVESFPKNTYKATQRPDRRKFAKDVPLDAKNGSYVMDGKHIAVYTNGTLERTALTGKTADRVKAFIPLRDAYQVVLDAMTTGQDDATVQAAQKQLTKFYNAFVKEFGHVNLRENRKAIKADPNASRIITLEVVETYSEKDASGKKKRVVDVIGLADIFTKRVIPKTSEPTSAASSQDALVQSLVWKGHVDLEYMAGLLGSTPDALTQSLAGELFFDPTTKVWVSREEYLSGDVVTKLAQAQAAASVEPSLKPNVDALEKVQPAPKTPETFEAPFGATWVPEDIYATFLREVGHVPSLTVVLSNTEHRTKFHVDGFGGTHEFMPEGTNYIEWVSEALNNELPRIYDEIKINGETSKVFNQEKTDQYRESLKQLREQWAVWWKNHDEPAEKLTDIYNALLNRESPRVFDGSRIEVIGANPSLTWHPWQKNVIWRTLQAGNTMVAHAVGAGKTFAGIAIAGEWKRLGLARKPMIVVPNHLVEQWRADFQYVYPGARVLVPEETDFAKDKRQELIARITNQDWDAVVMAQSQYLRIAVKLETLKAFIQQQEDELIADGAEQHGTSVDDFKNQVDEKESGQKGLFGRGTTASVKDIVRAILNLRARLRKRLDQQKKGSPVTFEELGVDGLIVDEAHMFKNLYFSTSKNDIVGLKGSDAARSMDMFLKARYINEHSNYRNLVFMTGTPVTNTMSEVYTVFRYLAQASLNRVGMAGFDSWANAFAVAAPESEPKPGGGYKERTRLRYWVNLRELTGMFWRFADVFTTKQLIEAKKPDGTPVVTLPAVKGGRPTIITTPPPPGHDDFMADIRARLEALKSGKVDPKDDNHLKIYTQASLEAIDMRLVDPTAEENPQGRLVAAAAKIADIYRDSAENLGTQLVFLNAGSPRTVEALNLGPRKHDDEEAGDADKMVADEDKGEIVTDEEEAQAVLDAVAELESGRDLYKDLKRKLVAKGIKANEIAFIHQAPEPGDKVRLFRAVREGRIRVLIGTGAKMGTGMNVQTRVVAIHELDAPWRPDWLEQQEARGLRQGNTNKEVEIIRYVTKGSFEEYRWGLLATKQDFLTKFYRGELDSMEDLDPAQMDQKTAAALASGNPDALTLVNKDRELKSLRARRVNFLQRQRKARRAIDSGDAEAKRDEQRIAQNDADLKVLDEWAKKPTVVITHSPSRFYMEELETPVSFDMKDPEARKAFQAKLEALLLSGYSDYRNEPVVVGKVGPYMLAIQSFSRDEYKTVNGEPHMDRVQVKAPQLFLSNENTIGEKRRGELRTVLPFASLPEWDEKAPPDYRRSLDAHMRRDALEKLGGFSRKSLEHWKNAREGHLEVLGKQFGQDAELDALEAEVRRLRISVGQDEAVVPGTPEAETAEDDDEDGPDAMAMGGGRPRRHMMPLPGRRALPTVASGPAPAGPQMNRDEILAAFQKFFADVPMNVRRFSHRAAGIYKPDVQAIRTKVSKDLQVILHELGHHVDKAVMNIRPARASGANRAAVVELETLGAVTTPPSKLKDRQYKRKEGAAEYLRLWFTEPDAARTQAPAFTALFEAYLNSDKALGTFFREQQAQIQGLLAMTPEQELEERIDWNGEPGKFNEFRDWVLGTTSDSRNALQKLNDSLNDDNLPILRLEQAMDAGLPAKSFAESAYIAFRMLAGTSGQAQTYLEDAIRRGDGTIMGPGFHNAVKDVLNRQDYKTFVAYLVARRAQEYQEQGLETGIRPETVDAAMAATVPDRFRDAAEKVTKYWDTLLQWAVEKSYLSNESAAAMRERNTRYVPWERVMDAADQAFRGPGTKKQNTPQAIKARTGSARRIVDPIVTSIKNTFAFVRTVEENAARLKLVDLVQDEGGARFLERVSMKQVATRFNLDRVRQAILGVLAANGVTVGEEIPNDIEFDALVTVFTPAVIAQGDARIITVLRDGKREWYEVHDDAIWELLVNAQPQGPRNWLTKIATGAASLLRRTATSTLSFASRNVFRDTIDAKTKAAYHHSFLKSLAAGGLILKNDESWQRFRASKAAQASIVSVDRNYAKNEIKKFQHGRLRRTLDMTVFNPFEGLRALAELSDNATRLQAFRETEKKLRAQGIGGEELETRAGFTSRESTQDFAKMGSLVRRYNRYEAFLGARIGGWTRIATELGNPDKRATYAFKAFLYGILPGLLLWWLNRDDPEYGQLPAWERAAYWHIPNGNKGWIRIPRPFDVGDIGNVLEAYLDWAVENDPQAIQRLPFVGMAKADTLKLFLSLSPTAVLPILEAIANYDTFRKRPIVSPFDIDLPLEQQYSQWTSTFSRHVGPAIGLAPAMLDHIIYGYTSATGQFVSGLVSKGEELAGWAPPSPSRGLRNVPGVGGFVGQRATSQATSLETFRNRKDSLEQYSRTVNRYVREGQIPKAQELLAKNPKNAQELSGLRRADAQIRLVTKQIGLVRQRYDLSPGEKRELYDRLYDTVIDMARYANGEAPLPVRYPPIDPGLLVKVPSTMHAWLTKPRLERQTLPVAGGTR